jgi:diacylglycerol O-acyltransferase
MPTDRLTPLDTTFLHLEDGSTSHMHLGGVMLFEGDAPPYDDLLAAIERRLHLVPRYRQRLVFSRFGLAEPEWADDPHFNLEFHVRHTALPRPGGERQLRALAGRVFSQRLDRDRPLWEMWLVERLENGRFALISKTHHALVDGISGVDIGTVLFDTEPVADDAGRPPRPWIPRPLPPPAETFAGAVAHRILAPAAALRSAVDQASRPAELLDTMRTAAGGLGAMLGTVLHPAPASPYNVPIGPHRRFTWVDCSLDEVRAVKNALGGTVNDVVLTAVAGALRRHLRRRGTDVDDLELIAMVPVSVRSDIERGALGNKVSSMFAPLPVNIADPVERLHRVSDAMRGLKESGQAVGAAMLTQISGLAPPTIIAQAARLAASSRTFNLTVTNVPGPQIAFYMLGRRLLELAPFVPLAPNHALGIAIISYNGNLCFGLAGDYDVLHDLDDIARDLRAEVRALVTAAGGNHDKPSRAAKRSAAVGKSVTPARKKGGARAPIAR